MDTSHLPNGTPVDISDGSRGLIAGLYSFPGAAGYVVRLGREGETVAELATRVRPLESDELRAIAAYRLHCAQRAAEELLSALEGAELPELAQRVRESWPELLAEAASAELLAPVVCRHCGEPSDPMKADDSGQCPRCVLEDAAGAAAELARNGEAVDGYHVLAGAAGAYLADRQAAEVARRAQL